MKHFNTGTGVVLWSTLWLALGLMTACSSGSAERVDPFEREVAPARDAFDEDFGEGSSGPSLSHGKALANQPTEEALSELPAELQCDGDIGGKVLQRLNRTEYNNTVRDLLGDDSHPADEFPKDDFGDSFDNNARALSVSPLLSEQYLAAAERLAATAVSEDNPLRDAIFVCRPTNVGAENCAREILTQFLIRAFRRPLLDDEIQRYVALFDAARAAGASFDQGVQVSIEAALLSVHFLYRVELDVDPESDSPHRVTAFELASRLSYFLWASMPDDELFIAAETGTLLTEAGIRAQVTRMLDDPKAAAMLESFAGRWLETDDIAQSNRPSKELFPEYTPELKSALEEETRLFMADVLSGEVSFDEILRAEHTYVNALLAEHYGIDGDFDDEFERVDLAGTDRMGLLTQGSILTLTGAPTRTSPVRRGVYVLSNLLCDAPPPPPPNVEGALEAAAEDETETLADRTRAHAEDPACAGCHVLMDPIGLGLENFDPIGRFRTEENGTPIDATGSLLVDGDSVDFSGATELSLLLADDSRLKECATQKLLTYALGRIVDPSAEGDSCRLEALQSEFESLDYNFRELIELITLTDTFRARRGGLAGSEQ